MISSMLEPASRFSNTVATGIRVPRNTHAPLRLSGTLSTAGHCDQSRVAISIPSYSSYLETVSRQRFPPSRTIGVDLFCQEMPNNVFQWLSGAVHAHPQHAVAVQSVFGPPFHQAGYGEHMIPSVTRVFTGE